MCNESLSFVERNLQNGSRGVEMKLEVGKIYLNENGDPVFIWKRNGERFSGLDVKYNMVVVYCESGKTGITNGNLVCEYSKPTLDLMIECGVVVKDSLGRRVWLKANIESLPYPLIGMLVDSVGEQAMYKADELFKIAYDDEIDNYEMVPSIREVFEQYWRGEK